MDLAKISPDLKNLVRNCYVSRLIRVSSGFREKIRDRTKQIEFWRRKPIANHRSSRVSRQFARARLNLPGGSGHRLSWTPLPSIMRDSLNLGEILFICFIYWFQC